MLVQVWNVQATNSYVVIIVFVFQNPGNVMTLVTVVIHQMKMDVTKPKVSLGVIFNITPYTFRTID